jgi:aromatic ring-opening dioxygenase LigB subunit
MTLEFACIAPHGGELIPELAKPGEKRFSKTREGIRYLARRIAAAKPDTIVIASPHNLRLVENIAIVVTENSTGSLQTSPGRRVALKAQCNVTLARELLRESKTRGLPVVGANFGSFEGPSSDIPMDWGTLVPLWFVLKERKVRSRVVIIAPSREIPIQQNVGFGRILAKVVDKRRSGRVVFIASADQAHTHLKSGPYGFSPKASKFDQLVVKAIETNSVDSLVRLNPSFVNAAKPDSIWQVAILAGVLDKIEMRPMLISYEVPTYYGMICAGFERIL